LNFMNFGLAIFLGHDSMTLRPIRPARVPQVPGVPLKHVQAPRAGPRLGGLSGFRRFSVLVAPRINSTCPAAELLNACATFAPPDSASGHRSSSTSLADARDRSGAGTGFGHWIHVFCPFCIDRLS